MAFANSIDFTVNHSKFVDKSIIGNVTTSKTKIQISDGFQQFLNSISMNASFDSQARYPPPRCDEDTRTALLEHIFRFIDSGKEDILFLNGPAGAGKSAVAQTVAAVCAERNILAGSYFFCRGSPSRNTITLLIPTMAHHLTERKKLRIIVKRDPFILDKSPEVQLCKLILKPHQQSLIRKIGIKRKRRFIIIDGLDECNGDDDQRRVVKIIGQLVDKKHGIVRCLIASRPEPQILSAMHSLPAEITVARVTLNEDSWDAERDIQTYLRSHFDEISSRLALSTPRPWPSDEILETLVNKAGGIFIYAATVVRYIDDEDALPTVHLQHVLKTPRGTTPFAELDMLYHQILVACPPQHRETLFHIFGLVFLQNPGYRDVNDISMIEALLNLSPGEVCIVLRRMHSILTITTTGYRRSISFFHASFGDFIFNEERSGQFFVNRERESLFLATRCIDYMGGHGQELYSIIMNDVAMTYAWNSWFYHGMDAGDSYFADLVTRLCSCDKSTWDTAITTSCHQFCLDGLSTGITRLKLHGASGITPDLQVAIEELSRKLCECVLISPLHPRVLGVFEDPGIRFFDRGDHYIVVLAPDNRPLTFLYLGYQKTAHDLGWWDADFVLRVFDGEPGRIWEKHEQGIVAIECLDRLGSRGTDSNLGLCYAVKYWAKHISLSETSSVLLSRLWRTELREAKPERQITLADVTLVIRWLERDFVVTWEGHELLSLWKGYHQELQSNPGLGLFTTRVCQKWSGSQDAAHS